MDTFHIVFWCEYILLRLILIVFKKRYALAILHDKRFQMQKTFSYDSFVFPTSHKSIEKIRGPQENTCS